MYASRTRKEKFWGHDENSQKNVSDLEGNEFQVTGPAIEKARTPVSWYEQLTAAGRPQVLPTSNVWGVDTAIRHVLRRLVLLLSLFSSAVPREGLLWVEHCAINVCL